MQIILIPKRLAKTRTITLEGRHIAASVAGALLALVVLAAALYWATLRVAAELRLPLLDPLISEVQERENARAQEFLRQNLNAMAIKLGEMQAQLARLDALGERLLGIAGVRSQEFGLGEVPGRGGALPASPLVQDLSLAELRERLGELGRQMESRTDFLGVLEAQLFEQAVKRKLLPTMMPIDAPFNASGFGPRIDPFTGQLAMHEGIDFIADVGTPVVAAATGVVQFAGYHPQYGWMIDLDHGNDFSTRYAHLSRILVKEGAVVQRGRKIAESGNSGRSTGPHLHFEVRYRGVAQNPMRFLSAGSAAGSAALAAPRHLARAR